MKADAWGLAPGFHGFHVHAVGQCVPPFTSAGGHLDPVGATHGDHAGDLPSLLLHDDGTGELRFTTDRFSLADLSDLDGSALIVHANRDNYANIPDRYHSHPPTPSDRTPTPWRPETPVRGRRAASCAAREPVAVAKTASLDRLTVALQAVANSEDCVWAPPAPGKPPRGHGPSYSTRAVAPSRGPAMQSPRREEPNESDTLGGSRAGSGRAAGLRRYRRGNPRHAAERPTYGRWATAPTRPASWTDPPGTSASPKSTRTWRSGATTPSTATTTASGSSTSRTGGTRSSSHTLGARATRATSWSGRTS